MGVNQRLAGCGCNHFVGLKAPVAADVDHGVTALGKHAPHEQASMAVGGVFLSAQQSHAEALHAGLESRNPGLELAVIAEPPINDTARGVVVSRVRRTSAKLRTKEEIADSSLFEGPLNEFLVELQNILRVGRTAYIHHHFYSVLADQGEPRLNIVVGVAESEETAHAPALAKENSILAGSQCFWKNMPEACLKRRHLFYMRESPVGV